MSEIAILRAFEGMPSQRRGQGKRHSLQLCLALFTLAVAAGNQGFEAIGDWLKYYWEELTQLLGVDSLPSYSTIHRVLLGEDYVDYAARLSNFFGVNPEVGETISLDGKTLKGSYVVQENNPTSEPHQAVILVTAYVVERGLILPPKQVEFGSNEITDVLNKKSAWLLGYFTFFWAFFLDFIESKPFSCRHFRLFQQALCMGAVQL